MPTNTEIENELSRLAVRDAADNMVVSTPLHIKAIADVLQEQGLPQVYFIADRAYLVTSIREMHDYAQTSADGVSLQVSKVTGTTAPTIGSDGANFITTTAYAGGDFTIRGFDMKGIAVNTVTDGTLTTIASSLTLAAGDRLVYGINGTLQSTFVSLTTVLRKV